MPLDFRNINTLWTSIIVETLAKLGVEYAVISPGSRSTPLTITFAENKQINTLPILDERSAAFFALGIAKKTHKPTVLVCTSGTAGANFYPAIIEAKYSNVPLIILTADRPPELRNCHAGQAINQVKLYADYPNWHCELSLPSTDLEQLFYLRQNIIYAWERSLYSHSGVVHLNIPFREPLAPIKNLSLTAKNQSFIQEQLFANFPLQVSKYIHYSANFDEYLTIWSKSSLGMIIAGVDTPNNDLLYCQAIAILSQQLNFPVLAEALSPVRNYSHFNPNIITNYDAILRNPEYGKELKPEIVILVGKYPTSKTLRNYLQKHKIKTYIIANCEDNIDALHSNSLHLRMSLETSVKLLIDSEVNSQTNYLHKWLKIEQQVNHKLQQILANNEEILEGKVSWMLSQYLPEKTPIFIANSMSVRYAEYFWQKNDRQFSVYFSRGANGIDGTLSTALGVAHHNQPTVLLTGDLALLHDTNGFLINSYLQGSLTIILINNNGGGIFEMLPIAEYSSVYEEYFATPQSVDFANLCHTYNLTYKAIDSWLQLQNLLVKLPTQGIYLWEIKTNRKKDSFWLKETLNNLNSG
jgi:2-succinyl-5-enolpyruvyl-6-hydroxy-3-cyclohexene-1-carboxylate synthase